MAIESPTPAVRQYKKTPRLSLDKSRIMVYTIKVRIRI